MREEMGGVGLSACLTPHSLRPTISHGTPYPFAYISILKEAMSSDASEGFYLTEDETWFYTCRARKKSFYMVA